MKKGWKIFWSVCVLTVVIGIGMSVVGVGMGATPLILRQAYEKAEIRWENKTRGIKRQISTTERASEYVMEFNGIRDMEIEVDYIELEIRTGEGDTITVDTSQLEDKLRDDLRIESEGAELKLERQSTSPWDAIGENKAGRIVMTIPGGSTFEQVSFDVGAGLLKIDDIFATKLKVNVGAGKSIIDKFQADELDVECTVGHMVLNGAVKRDVNIECGVGGVQLQLTGRQSDYNYELEAGTGDIIVGDDSYRGIVDEHTIDNRASKKMEINSNTGKVEVTFMK